VKLRAIPLGERGGVLPQPAGCKKRNDKDPKGYGFAHICPRIYHANFDPSAPNACNTGITQQVTGPIKENPQLTRREEPIYSVFTQIAGVQNEVMYADDSGQPE
jgi:hypothetical protein